MGKISEALMKEHPEWIPVVRKLTKKEKAELEGIMADFAQRAYEQWLKNRPKEIPNRLIY